MLVFDSKSHPALSAAKQREQLRLAAALRDNLKRRKVQVRGRNATVAEAGMAGAAQDNALPPDANPPQYRHLQHENG